MFWWFNVFAPQVHWPLSGSVAQDIRPELFAKAGDADTERRVLTEVVSYGRQIGALSDLAMALAEQAGPEAGLSAKGQQALQQLHAWADQISARKSRTGLPTVPDDPTAALALLQALVQRHPDLLPPIAERPAAGRPLLLERTNKR